VKCTAAVVPQYVPTNSNSETIQIFKCTYDSDTSSISLVLALLYDSYSLKILSQQIDANYQDIAIHPEWSNVLQYIIVAHASGNTLNA